MNSKPDVVRAIAMRQVSKIVGDFCSELHPAREALILFLAILLPSPPDSQVFVECKD
jgi:hypothetical protein